MLSAQLGCMRADGGVHLGEGMPAFWSTAAVAHREPESTSARAGARQTDTGGAICPGLQLQPLVRRH